MRSDNQRDRLETRMLCLPVHPMINHRAKNGAPLGLSILTVIASSRSERGNLLIINRYFRFVYSGGLKSRLGALPDVDLCRRLRVDSSTIAPSPRHNIPHPQVTLSQSFPVMKIPRHIVPQSFHPMLYSILVEMANL